LPITTHPYSLSLPLFHTTTTITTTTDMAFIEGGNVVVGWSYDDVPPVPLVDIPPSSSDDTHECVRREERAQVRGSRW